MVTPASKKEVDDSLDGKTVADMTRNQGYKVFVSHDNTSPHYQRHTLVVVNHTYKEIGMFPKDIVGGGTGSYYSADTIWILGRQQDKDKDGSQGYHFIINVEKSRYVKEKSKIPISVSFNGGMQKYSGLLDLAMQAQLCNKASPGWYAKVDRETGEVGPKYA